MKESRSGAARGWGKWREGSQEAGGNREGKQLIPWLWWFRGVCVCVCVCMKTLLNVHFNMCSLCVNYISIKLLISKRHVRSSTPLHVAIQEPQEEEVVLTVGVGPAAFSPAATTLVVFKVFPPYCL